MRGCQKKTPLPTEGSPQKSICMRVSIYLGMYMQTFVVCGCDPPFSQVWLPRWPGRTKQKQVAAAATSPNEGQLCLGGSAERELSRRQGWTAASDIRASAAHCRLGLPLPVLKRFLLGRLQIPTGMPGFRKKITTMGMHGGAVSAFGVGGPAGFGSAVTLQKSPKKDTTGWVTKKSHAKSKKIELFKQGPPFFSNQPKQKIIQKNDDRNPIQAINFLSQGNFTSFLLSLSKNLKKPKNTLYFLDFKNLKKLKTL